MGSWPKAAAGGSAKLQKMPPHSTAARAPPSKPHSPTQQAPPGHPSTHPTHLLGALHDVHEAVVVVVVVRALGGVDRQQQVVAPQAVPLGVLVGEDAGLQQLVITVVHACSGT